MASYSILIKPSAIKELEDIPTKKDRGRIVTRIRSLTDDPRPRGCEKLSARERFRVRQGRYRIVYEVDEVNAVVTVVKIGHRKDVYQ